MRSFRWNYWSCSPFADWVRGEKKPLALGFKEWEDWRRENSAKRPVRFFLAETVLDKVQDFFMMPRDFANSLYHWWYNRFVSKTHFLKTGLEPGRFHELDERILHGLFNELVEFVEVDLAFMGAYDDKKKYRFVRGRCPEAGADYLLWASSLKFGEDDFMEEEDPMYGRPTPQAEAAVSIARLYKWWTQERPNRVDPHVASGWDIVYEDDYSPEKDRAANSLQEIEEGYDREDEEMLTLLIKIRKHLWT